MRLLIIEPGLELWGSERALLETMPAILDNNEKVVLVAPQNAGIFEALKNFDLETSTADIGNLHKGTGFSKLKALFQLWNLCGRYKIQKVYLNQAGLCKIVGLLCRLRNMPLVIHVRMREDVARVARMVDSDTVSLSTIHISDAMHQLFKKEVSKIFEAELRHVIAYDPFRMRNYNYRHNSIEDAQAQFVCVGRLAKLKGQAELLNGLHRYKTNEAISAKIDFFGSAPPKDNFDSTLERLVATLDLSAEVRFLGYQNDVSGRLSAYKYMFVPSIYEALGRVVMEAWEAGIVPIASSESGGPAEIIIKSGGGILYEGHSPDAIAQAIKQALSVSESARYELVENGRSWAQKNLNLRTYKTKLHKILFHYTHT